MIAWLALQKCDIVHNIAHSYTRYAFIHSDSRLCRRNSSTWPSDNKPAANFWVKL